MCAIHKKMSVVKQLAENQKDKKMQMKMMKAELNEAQIIEELLMNLQRGIDDKSWKMGKKLTKLILYNGKK